MTAAIPSVTSDLAAVLDKARPSHASERQGRLADSEGGGSLERQKREGYF